MALDTLDNDRETPTSDSGDARIDATNSRRSFLGRTVGVAVGAVAGLSVVGNAVASTEVCPIEGSETIDDRDENEEDETARTEGEEEAARTEETEEVVETATGHEQFAIGEGTPYETPVYVVDAPRDGPTAVVTGGVHGSESAGIEAAWEITEWKLESGRLVVIPEANAVAVARGTYTGSTGDLNQQFPTGRAPTTANAREIWGVITGYDADVVVDLHTSSGVYGVGGPSGVGQAIFPTAPGRSIARQARNTVNAAHFQGIWTNYYSYTIGNTMTGARPRLIHKVGGDLSLPGFLVEATRHGTSLSDRTEWLTANTKAILERTGFEL